LYDQRLRQVDPHHRVDDLVGHRAAPAVGDLLDAVAVLDVLADLVDGHVVVAQYVLAIFLGRRVRAALEGVVPEPVLVELQPDVAERIRRVVRIGDRLRTRDAPRVFVEADLDPVVGALLPVLRAGCAGRGAIDVGCRQVHVELPESVVKVALGLADCVGLCGAGEHEQGGEDQSGNSHRIGAPVVRKKGPVI